VLKKHSEFFVSIFFIFELLLVSFSWLLSYSVRFHLKFFVLPLKYIHLSTYLWYLFPVLLFWIISSKIFKLYRPRRIGSGPHELIDIVKAVTMTLIVLLCFTYATKRFEFSRLAFFYFWIGTIMVLSIERTVVRNVLKSFRKRGYNLRFALVIGSGGLVRKLQSSLVTHPELGIVVNGIVTFKREEVDTSIGGIPIIGFIDDLEEILEQQRCDIVFVALPIEGHHYMGKLLKSLMGRMIDIKIVPDVYEYIALKEGLDTIDAIPLVSLQTSPLFGWNRVFKRSFDVAVATLFLVTLSPIFLFIVILVKVTSKGPIFFVQERVGMDCNVFKMYKFRSMKMDAEKETGPIWASKADPRKTKIGAFLRKFDLDELPQLINVLKGEMSLVGPRPERPFFVEKFKNHVSYYMLRHKIKAGMTGWAQVNGFRGNTSLEKRIEHDLFYIKNWSIWFDIKILLMTMWRGFKNHY